MTINERLALMDEISRKNNAEWDKFRRNPRSNRHKGEKPPHSFHPLTEWALECLITFCAVILMGAVALIS